LSGGTAGIHQQEATCSQCHQKKACASQHCCNQQLSPTHSGAHVPQAWAQLARRLCDNCSGVFLSCIQLYVERLAKAVRKKRADAEKAAAEAQHGMGAKQAAAQGDSTQRNSSDVLLGTLSSVADGIENLHLVSLKTALLYCNSG